VRPRFAALVAILTLSTLLPACAGRAPFDDTDASRPGFGAVDRTLTADGLDVCDRTTDPAGLANQAVATRTYVVALDCGTDDVVRVLVDRYHDEDDRDGAARHFESLLRPRGDGAVWTWGPFTLFANGGRDDDVMERLTMSLDRAGAR
jgi:hypothetical protein